jgi:hypothetical protein
MTMPEFLEEIAICEDRETAQSGRMTPEDFDELQEWMDATK